MTKAEVRADAARLGLATADKPDSQDVCFITATGGRETFLGSRIALAPRRRRRPRRRPRSARVDAVELVTLGQRRGLGLPRRRPGPVRGGRRRGRGGRHRRRRGGPAHRPRSSSTTLAWVAGEVDGRLLAQCSRPRRAPRPCRVDGDAVVLDEPARRVAPGQSVVLYAGDLVGRLRHRRLTFTTVRPACYSPISSGPALVFPGR